MDVKEAISAAKQCINSLFADEGLANLRLEEVEFDDEAQTWNITLGFLRPMEKAPVNGLAASIFQQLELNQERDYKVVRINDGNAKVLSVKNREPNG
jgi:hypothetical protein